MIWNNKTTFIKDSLHTLYEDNQNLITTIAGQRTLPTGMGSIHLKITDDDQQVHRYTFNNVLYLPQSPVNVLSVSVLASMFNDLNNTHITSKWLNSKLTWDNGNSPKHPSQQVESTRDGHQ
jgi:hypothetical protein